MLNVPKNVNVKMPSTLFPDLAVAVLHMLLNYYTWIHNSEGKPLYMDSYVYYVHVIGLLPLLETRFSS